MRMDEVFEMRNGYTPATSVASNWEDGAIPWFRMEDIRQNGRILSDSLVHVTPSAVKGGRLFPAGSLILSTSATIGEHALLTCASLCNQRFTNLTVRDSCAGLFHPRYLFYYMFRVGEWCRRNTNVSGFSSVDMTKLKSLLLPIPPLDEQRRIVAILDRFSTLAGDLSTGLPALIAAVGEQYEYYRDRLLTFPKTA